MSWPFDLAGLRRHGPYDATFGDLRAEARLALEATVVAPLAHLGTIRASGPDTESFLQGQLSNDVRKLSDQAAQLTSYNSPKGRMLAVLTAFRDPQAWLLEVHASVLDAVLRRLRLHVLRAKTSLEDASGNGAIIGVSGPGAAALVADADLAVPESVLGVARSGETAVMRRHDANGRPRYTLHVPAGTAAARWERLAARAPPVGTAAWRLLDIEAGVPVIYPQTSDRFVAQMCNLDGLGGISFEKGCYTGQEVIARVHYRGAVKRHMARLPHPDAALAPGTRLETPAGAEVVEAAPAPDGGSLALVVAADPESRPS